MKSGYLLSTLLATVGALSACAMDGAEPELGTAEVDRGHVVAVCAAAPSLSAAGRTLFARSLAQRTTRNDADRLRKYLARFGADFEGIQARMSGRT